MKITTRVAAIATALLLVSSMAACSKSAATETSTTSAKSSTSLKGALAFNQAKLGELDQKLKSALQGKDLSAVNIAMVVNVAADYWKAGQVGFQAGCKDLGIDASKCTYFAPPSGKLTEQTSELETLKSQGVTGYSISAIDPTSTANTTFVTRGPVNASRISRFTVLGRVSISTRHAE